LMTNGSPLISANQSLTMIHVRFVLEFDTSSNEGFVLVQAGVLNGRIYVVGAVIILGIWI